MRLYLKFFVPVIWITIVSISLSTSVYAEETPEIETKITAGLGIEYFEYEEQLPEAALTSSADVSNIVIKVEGVKRWEDVFIGFQVVVPVVNIDSREKWFVNTTLDQSNSLEYGMYQLGAFIGYPASPLFNPYLGTRSTWSDQKRSDFRTHAGSLVSSLKITEEASAHYISLGFRGGMSILRKMSVAYGAEYNFPYHSKVSNDGLPGWEVTNIDGYLWSIYSEAVYFLIDKFSISLFLSVGQIHWAGSDWQTYNNGQVKWPENDTHFVCFFLNFNWSF